MLPELKKNQALIVTFDPVASLHPNRQPDVANLKILVHPFEAKLRPFVLWRKLVGAEQLALCLMRRQHEEVCCLS